VIVKEADVLNTMNEYYRGDNIPELTRYYHSVQSSEMPRIHEQYALIMVSKERPREALPSLLTAIQWRTKQIQNGGKSEVKYKLGLCYYNSLVISEGMIDSSINRTEYLAQSFWYLTESMGDASNENMSGSEWEDPIWTAGYSFLPKYYRGELAMMREFNELPTKVGLTIPGFDPRYSALADLSFSGFFIETLLKRMQISQNQHGIPENIKRMVEHTMTVLTMYKRDVSELILKLKGDISNLDQSLVMKHSDYLDTIMNKMREKRTS
jgi:hypothetical protein